MYQNLGINWASSVPAFLALACVPFPFLFYKYGATIREKCKYAAQAKAFLLKLQGGGAQDAEKNEKDESDHPSSESEKGHEAGLGGEHDRTDSHGQNGTADDEHRFEEIKTGPSQATRTHAARSSNDTATADDVALQRTRSYQGNPFHIDRVATRESFRERSNRSPSVKSGKSGKSGKLGGK